MSKDLRAAHRSRARSGALHEDRAATAVRLGPEPRPEGGWYRRTRTSPAAAGDRPAGSHRLGPDAVQVLVPAGSWRCTAPVDGEVLVSCVVSPGSTEDGFELG